MASVKKVKPIKIIGKEEFIDAFNLHLLVLQKENKIENVTSNQGDYESLSRQYWHRAWLETQNDDFKRLQAQRNDEKEKYEAQNNDDYERNINTFVLKYGRSWVNTIWEIFRWRSYIFKGKSIISSAEAYKNYNECISQNRKEPLKTIKWINGKEEGIEWVFNGYAYMVKGFYADNEIRLLILEDFDTDRKYFEKLNVKFNHSPYAAS